MSYYSLVETIGAGLSNILAVPFPYLRKSTVHVYVDGVEVPSGGLVWSGAGAVILPGSPSDYVGKTLRVQRFTPLSAPEVTFGLGGLDAADLNRAVLQDLYCVQEGQDQTTLLGASLVATALALNNRITQVDIELRQAIGAVVVSGLDAQVAYLPTFLPPIAGRMWLNGGVICVS